MKVRWAAVAVAAALSTILVVLVVSTTDEDPSHDGTLTKSEACAQIRVVKISYSAELGQQGVPLKEITPRATRRLERRLGEIAERVDDPVLASKVRRWIASRSIQLTEPNWLDRILEAEQDVGIECSGV